MEGEDNQGSPPLCSMGCGFFGNPETRNLCSKCYISWLREEMKLTDTSGIPTQIGPEATTTTRGDPVEDESVGGRDLVTGRRPRRCDSCKMKVGLLGFHCRCGGIFCGVHRHPEMHVCSFDYKTMGRELLVKTNPIVKSQKLERIT